MWGITKRCYQNADSDSAELEWGLRVCISHKLTCGSYTPVFLPGESHGHIGGGVWWATVHGVTESEMTESI